MDLPRLTAGQIKNSSLSKLGITKTFHAGETIVNENAMSRSIPVVIKGSIKVMQPDEDYKEILLYYLRPGETCIMSFLAGSNRDPLTGLFGAFFLFQAVTNSGCPGSKACSVPAGNTNQTESSDIPDIKDIDFTEINDR